MTFVSSACDTIRVAGEAFGATVALSMSRLLRKEHATAYNANQRIVSALRYPALHR